MEIKNSTTVFEALKKSKEVVKVFRKFNLDCPGCRGAGEDTIEKVATNNGLDLKAFLIELNASIK
jgi:hybrid cluster-associated redox disulfide protein